MKEELLRVLNNRLNSINSDINSLKELNNKIDEENEQLDFIMGIISLFNENGTKNPLNFDKIDKDDFPRVLDLAGDEVKNVFNGSACNYDGLVYLIAGIRNGVSISLTSEQLNGIDQLIHSLANKKQETDAKIDSYNANKAVFEISDLNELKTKKNKFEDVIQDVNMGEYVKDIDLLKESIDFSKLSPEETINILSYVLEYNANLYRENRPVVHKVEEEKQEENFVKEEIEEVGENNDQEFHFKPVENDNLFELPNITFDDDKEENNDIEEHKEKSTTVEESKPEEVEQESETFEENEVEYVPLTENVDFKSEPITPSIDEMPVASSLDDIEMTQVEEIPAPVDTKIDEEITVSNEEPVIDNDFKDIVVTEKDYEEKEEKQEEKTSTRELHKIFSKYGIEENVVLNELIDGDVKEYQKTLDSLYEHKILNYFKNNKELLIETLLYSDSEIVDRVLRIIKEDLSVDDEDYEITLRIVVNTIPSIFIREGGNYDNFIKNIELFKKLEINLINLFDFSKEIFVADNESIENNLAIVNKYGFDITSKNAKYFLLIPDIADKIDYYVESLYEVKEDDKTESFDGINYIKDFTAKLNVVKPETIKRLRYATETGKKVFGSKPGSLSGEITNLRVTSLDLNDDYLSKFFNNKFSGITDDEVREYIKLVHNSTNVGDYSDELDVLNTYRNGLRYVIEGINISYNKVLRNYSILRSYGVDAKKALQFAVCYNLIITKDEYNKLSDVLNRVGGNA